jgi:hypothetical protein
VLNDLPRVVSSVEISNSLEVENGGNHKHDRLLAIQNSADRL